MKKILIIALIVLFIALMITSCGNNETQPISTDEESTPLIVESEFITETDTELIETETISTYEDSSFATEKDIDDQTKITGDQIVSLAENTIFKDYDNSSVALNKIYNNPSLNISYTKKDSNYFKDLSQTENKIIIREIPEINDIESVSSYMDYCVFYSLECAEIYVGNNSLSTVKESLNKAFWNSLLMPSNVGYYIDENGIKDQKVMIHFLYNKSTCTYINSTNPKYTPLTIPYSYAGNTRSLDNTIFPYMMYSYQKLDVSNSEQLLYAFQNGYVPNIIKGSDAEVLYNRAIEILNMIISDHMTQNEKILAIMSYMHSHCTYDYNSDDSAVYTSSSLSSYPAYVATSFVSFHAEGPILYGQGVCQGFAKAYAILLGIEGIKSYKVTTVSKIIDKDKTINPVSSENVYDEHGYLYVKNTEDGKFYIVDPTYNYGINIMGMQSTRAFALLISYNDWHKVYSSLRPDKFYSNNASIIGNDSYNWYKDFKFIYAGKTYSMYIEEDTDSKEYKTALIDYLKNYDENLEVSHGKFLIIINSSSRENINKIENEIIGDTSYTCLPFFAYYGTDVGASCIIFFK